MTAPIVGVVQHGFRSGVDAHAASELEGRVWAALAEVPDPELPLVSVVDLGLIGRVSADPARIHVELLPTFVGCHALEVIQVAIADRLAGLAPVVEVEAVFDPPWTSDRITAEGRQRLRTMGVAPPGSGGASLISLDAPVTCPHCGSSRTRLENAFGPTQCRTIRYCPDCRQPFEAFKPV
ncbi:MAG TPA: 1,2-phenylacetyl-CoA epoxidase subunit PaaD [Candidatus Limnocylindrales bacterium]